MISGSQVVDYVLIIPSHSHSFVLARGEKNKRCESINCPLFAFMIETELGTHVYAVMHWYSFAVTHFSASNLRARRIIDLTV